MCTARVATFSCIWLIASAAPCRTSGRALDTAGHALVEEVIAGSEGNLALIEHGTATYSVRSTNIVPAGLSFPGSGDIKPGTYKKEAEVRVGVDYPRMRFEWRGTGRVEGEVVTVRGIRDDEYNLRFLVPWGFEPNSPPADACTVFIAPSSSSAVDCNYLHPREQMHGPWLRPPPFSERLREMLAHEEADAALTAARQPDGTVRISYEPGEGKVRGTYWVSPSEGYCVVRAEEWYEWKPGAKPGYLYEATARAADNGAFVLAHRLERRYTLSESGALEQREEESTLREIDLTVRPDPKLFTIDGLGLVEGARIRDQVHGRNYRYGVDATDESGILLPRPGGRMTGRYWFIGLNGLAGMLVIGWMIQRSKRGRPRPSA